MTGTPYIKSIELLDGSAIKLSHRSVLTLVGPNNVGKTYFLRLIRSHLHGTTVEETAPNNDLFRSLSIGWTGTEEESTKVLQDRTQENFKKTDYGYRNNNGINYPGSGNIKTESFSRARATDDSLGVFTDLFLDFDDAIERINETEPRKLIRPGGPYEPSLAQLAFESPQASERIRTYFRQIFHEDISFYQRYDEIGFLLGAEPEEGSRAGQALNEATAIHMDHSPKLWLQGLGMRSVLGLLFKVFAANKEIILIDEPEAFLHPPQAAALGAALAQIATEHHKQIIVATHDRNFLNGLLKSDIEVSIQRITRNRDESLVQNIDAETLSNVREKSLVRYSTVFDALFVRMTVLVENEKDAFFL